MTIMMPFGSVSCCQGVRDRSLITGRGQGLQNWRGEGKSNFTPSKRVVGSFTHAEGGGHTKF